MDTKTTVFLVVVLVVVVFIVRGAIRGLAKSMALDELWKHGDEAKGTIVAVRDTRSRLGSIHETQKIGLMFDLEVQGEDEQWTARAKLYVDQEDVESLVVGRVLNLRYRSSKLDLVALDPELGLQATKLN